MKLYLLQSKIVQSLIATASCALLAFGLFHFTGWFQARAETALWPQAITGELKCATPQVRLADEGRLKLVVQDEWYFDFHTKWLAEPRALYELPDLHAKALPTGDVEVRVWALPAFYPASVFILKRIHGHWKAALLGPFAIDIQNTQPYQSHLGISWEAVWSRLLAEGLLTLPEGSCIKENGGGIDGIGYVVEINLNGVYRVYGYSNPQYYPAIQEPKQMMKIACLVFPIKCEERTQ